MRGKYNIAEGLGIVALGRDLVSLDAILFNLTNRSILQSAGVNRAPIEMAQEEFGAYDRKALEESKNESGELAVTVAIMMKTRERWHGIIRSS